MLSEPSHEFWNGLSTAASVCGEKRTGDLKDMQQTRSRTWLMVRARRSATETRWKLGGRSPKGSRPKVTLSKAQGQSTRRSQRRNQSWAGMSWDQHSEAVLMTTVGSVSLPSTWGSSLGKHLLGLGFGDVMNLGIKVSCLDSPSLSSWGHRIKTSSFYPGCLWSHKAHPSSITEAGPRLGSRGVGWVSCLGCQP